MNYQNDALAADGIIACKSSRDRAKVAIDRTIRIVTGDVDWTVKIMGYKALEPIAHWSACESRSVLVSTTSTSIEPSVCRIDKVRRLHCCHLLTFFV